MENNGKRRIVYGVILAIVIIVLLYFYNKNVVEAPIVDNNEIEAIDKTYIEGNKDDLISFSIWPGTRVSGIRSYRGEIKGGYFFEGNILINVLDVNKKVLKSSNAVATTEWMTSDGVKFEGNIDFTGLPAGLGYIEIHNDNASGLPEHDKSVLIPIIIETIPTNNVNRDFKWWENLSSQDLIDIFSKVQGLSIEKEFGLSTKKFELHVDNKIEQVDLTGDGVNEAIVVGNGSNEVSFVLIKNPDGSISVAKQKNKNGMVVPVELVTIRVAGFQQYFEFLPAERSYYVATSSFTKELPNTYKCDPLDSSDGVRVYTWNNNTKMFEYNDALVAKYKDENCN